MVRDDDNLNSLEFLAVSCIEQSNTLTWPLTSGAMAAATGRIRLMLNFIAAVLVATIVMVIDESGKDL